MNCPRCSGATWDNRDRKRDGEMKPNAPDFACKDKEGCGWVKWPAKGAARAPTKESAPANGGKWTWVSLMATYKRSLLIAEKCLTEAQARNPKAVPFTHAEVLSAAATVFIAASRDGVREAPKPAPPPPEPEDVPDELPEDDTLDY